MEVGGGDDLTKIGHKKSCSLCFSEIMNECDADVYRLNF